LEEVAAQALQHLLVLEALEGLLEEHRELGSRRHWAVFRGGLPPTFVYHEIAWGGSTRRIIPEGRVSLPDVEWEGTAASLTLGLLKTRPVQVSSSSESTTTTTTPFYLSTGAGSVVSGAEVTEFRGDLSVEVPMPAAAALHLASSSANFFFLSLLKPISV